MRKIVKKKTNRLPFITSELAIFGYLFFRVLDAKADGSLRIVLAAVASNCAAMLTILAIHKLRNRIDEAFFLPMCIYLINIGGSFLMGSFLYFHPVGLVITCIGALFLYPKTLLKYIVLSNLISAVLIILGIPVMHPTRTILITEVIISWFLAFISSLFVFGVTFIASYRNNEAIKAKDSFTSSLLSTPNKIVLLDPLNQVTYISVSFMDLTTIDEPGMAIGRPIFDLFRDEKVRSAFFTFLKYDKVVQTLAVSTEQNECYYEVVINNLSGETGGKLVMLFDITPVMQAKFEAEAASRSKSTFLATMSHEIRTPLNAIIGLSVIQLQKKLPMEVRQDVEKIHNSGSNLLAIINDILDISKIEAGSFDLIPVDYDVPSLINDTVHLNLVRIGSKHIAFKLTISETIPAKLSGDELRMKQILNNLLSNAVKYTEEGSIHFNIVWEKQNENALLIFTVRDTGRGMKEEDVPRLFSDYTQLDAKANRHIEGTGLGLSITRNLVELMNGSISVQSEYGKGSVFTVRIPQRIINENPIGETTARNLERFRFRDTLPSRGLRLVRSYMPYGKVLVVDDVETNLDVTRGLLLPYGIAVDCALSGMEAIEKIKAAENSPENPRYDLILMDHMMPGMDGIETVRIIRSELGSEYASAVPIVALTANAIAGNEAMFLSRGFNAFISKPINVMQLDMALNTWVRDKQSRETLLQAEMEQARTKEEKQAPSVLDDLFVEGIDLIQGRERYNNEPAYLDILRSYHLHTPALLDKLRNFSPNPVSGEKISLAEYTVLIHGIKGSSYGICANDIGSQAEDIEAAGKAGDFETVSRRNADFIEKAELLLADLGELLKKVSGGKETKKKAPSPDPEALRNLLDAVKRYKSTQMEEILRGLESFEYENGGELISWLREQIDNLEYDAMRLRLEKPDPFAII